MTSANTVNAVQEAAGTDPAHGQAAAGVDPFVQQIFQFSTAYMISSALHVAVALSIPDRLVAGPRPADALAREAQVDADALYRLLRSLAAVGIFHEDAEGRFALTPSSQLLRAGVPGSLRPLVNWLCDPFHFRVYAELMHAVRTRQPVVEKVTGLPIFEHLGRDPELSATFNECMTSFSATMGPAVAEAYDFSGIGTLVDVAGGHGQLLATVLQRHPGMRGLLLDMEHVIAGARPHLAGLGLSDRCDTGVVDFFAGMPAGGDAYMMKHIIHDWDDEQCLVILGHVRRALEGKPRGRLIVIDAIVAPANEPDLSKMFDLEMLLMPGGRERTEAQFRALFEKAGFTLTRVVRTPTPLAVIEGVPR